MDDDFLYLKTIESARAKALTDLCPEDKKEMAGTGLLFKGKPPIGGWVVEYQCPNCSQVHRLRYFEDSTPRAPDLLREILSDLGENW